MIKMLYYHPSIKGIGRIKNNIIMLYTSMYFVEGKAQASHHVTIEEYKELCEMR